MKAKPKKTKPPEPGYPEEKDLDYLTPDQMDQLWKAADSDRSGAAARELAVRTYLGIW